ncbi:MAG: ABC transporter permease [Pseudomonadota bacterium]
MDAPDDAVVENGPVVAPHTVSGRGLTVVVAIMTFVCALLLGAAIVIDRAASQWSSTVLDDVSVTVVPLDGDPVERRLERVAGILSGAGGLTAVTIVPAAQSEALLEPWLGTGTDLSLLPLPRLVIAQRSGSVDIGALERALGDVPGVSLDDHSGWSERLANMASAITAGAIGTLALMLVATAISIVFATRAAIATNAATMDVLYTLGAEDRFIQRAFRGRFLRIGLRGALCGAAAALVLFGALEAWSMFSAAASSRQNAALLGSPSIGPAGFASLIALTPAVVLLVSATTTLTVRRHLDKLNR